MGSLVSNLTQHTKILHYCAVWVCVCVGEGGVVDIGWNVGSNGFLHGVVSMNQQIPGVVLCILHRVQTRPDLDHVAAVAHTPPSPQWLSSESALSKCSFIALEIGDVLL